MGAPIVRAWSSAVWDLQRRQHGVVTRSQLLARGLSPKAILHRCRSGRLHPLHRGVYAVGRPQLDQRGVWMAATLACGPRALLSHRSAAALWRIVGPLDGPIDVTVPTETRRDRDGIHVHRLAEPEARSAHPLLLPYARNVAEIPVTNPVATVVDIATCLTTGRLEAAVNEADHRELVSQEELRSAIEGWRRPGARQLRNLLDDAAAILATTRLERLFVPLVTEAGLPLPQGQEQLGPNRVDFFWPQLGLIVETDSLRYHRTNFRQSADKRRDNENILRGRLTLRFTHGQICREPGYVRSQLRRAKATLTRAQLGGNEPL